MFSVFVPSDFSLRKAVAVDLAALPESAVWIDLVKPTPEEDKAVERLAGIAVPTREDMQEIEISSRLYIENGARYMTATLMCHSDTDMPRTTAVTFILAGHRLVTVRYGHAKQYSQILIEIGRKGDLTSKVRESLVSIGRVVTFLSAVMEGVKWSKDMREQLKTMQRDVGSLTDHASYLSNKITFVLDAMLGVVNLEQNNIIKLFSVMAVVLMPPTLIASIYGMNFKDMPELEWVHGYPMALVAMVAAAVVPYWIFKLKKWL